MVNANTPAQHLSKGIAALLASQEAAKTAAQASRAEAPATQPAQPTQAQEGQHASQTP